MQLNYLMRVYNAVRLPGANARLSALRVRRLSQLIFAIERGVLVQHAEQRGSGLRMLSIEIGSSHWPKHVLGCSVWKLRLKSC